MGECDPRNFLQPCLLLLLSERADHGYDLANRLRELHVAEGDPGAVYRALRALEQNGLVRSNWQTSDAGPARRTYRLTPAGVVDLDRQAGLLEATHQTLHVFRSRFQRLKEVNGIVDGTARNRANHDHSSLGARGNGAASRPGERTHG
jgi:poly-beta-hydroxybutyrate-responsive repressor